MRYTTLGKTQLRCSVIGMGGVHYEGVGSLYTHSDAAVETLRAAYDMGVTVFDSAEGYGRGASERHLGMFLEQIGPSHRDEVVITTKAEIRRPDGTNRERPEEIVAGCEASLQRLGIDTIDVYQVHTPMEFCRELFMEAFARLKEAGKIRFCGVSSNDPEYIRAFDADGLLDEVQLAYNIYMRQPEERLFEMFRQEKYGTLVKTPLAWGMLTDAYLTRDNFDDGDARARGIFGDPERTKIYEGMAAYTRKLMEIVPSGYTVSQMALAWCIANDAIHVAIPGAANAEQARMNCAAADMQISSELDRQIRQLVPYDIPVIYY